MSGPLQRVIIVCLGLSSLPMLAQTLRTSSASGSSGERGALDLSLDSSVGPGPSVLKWETTFPAQLLDTEGSRPEIASLPRDAGKSLICTLRQVYVYVCILA